MPTSPAAPESAAHDPRQGDIKPTDVSVYTEWALQLQEELQRSVMLHQQLHQMRGQLESEKSELSIALGRPGPRPAAPAKVASRGSSLPSAPASVDGLQRLAGASAGGAAACMCSGVRHASPQVAPPTGKRKRNHAAMGAGAWQASEPQLSTSAGQLSKRPA